MATTAQRFPSFFRLSASLLSINPSLKQSYGS